MACQGGHPGAGDAAHGGVDIVGDVEDALRVYGNTIGPIEANSQAQAGEVRTLPAWAWQGTHLAGGLNRANGLAAVYFAALPRRP